MKTLEDALAAIEELKAAHEVEKTAILAKNKELVDREKKAKADADAAKEAAERAAEEQASKSSSIEEVRAALESKHKREIEKLTRERDEITAGYNRLVVDNQIAADLVAHNVAKPFHSILTQALKAQATVTDGVAYINGQPISEYVSGFLTSDDGQHYVSAPVNTGGGATGATVTKANTWSKENFNLTEYSKLAKSDPVEAAAVSERLGMNYHK